MLITILNSDEPRMRKILFKIALIASVIIINSCITPFEPEGVTSIDNMVVIEGDIIQNDTTRISVSRSLAIRDENKVNYITKATVWVENEKGTKYTGKEVLKKGKTQYLVNTNGIDPSLNYKVCVRLIGGQLYVSDLVPMLVSPQIDSIGFTTDLENKSATFYVNTHDPQNNTKYYKWSYTEDWEFHSQYISLFEYDPFAKIVREINFDKNRYYCWSSATSSSILAATTSHLAQDRIYQKPLVSMGPDDKRISVLYSMELTQMAISSEAYLYWDNIRKNSDNIGGIFSPQPSEIGGNIHCVNNPSERVLGYISAGLVAKKRIFAKEEDIGIYQEPNNCEIVIVPDPTQLDGPPVTFQSLYEGGYDVISYSEVPRESIWVIKSCSDCRVFGTKTKPKFWPNDHI